MTRRFALLVAASMLGCTFSDPEPVASDQAAIGVTLNRGPDGIDCIAFTLASEDGTTQTHAYAAARFIDIPNVTVGAYNLSAVAYASGLTGPVSASDCAAIPASAPWTTEQPIPVVVQRDTSTAVTITLMRTGDITVRASFFEAPEVVASGQGNVGLMAANGSFVVWAVNAVNAGSQIVQLIDGAAPPLVVASGLVNIGMIALDDDSDTIYWEDGRSGRTDSNGRIINDGAVFSDSGAPPITGLFPSDLAVASANHALYWSELTTGTIDCFGCLAPLATGVAGGNTLGASGDRVYWGSAADRTFIFGMNLSDGAPTQLAELTPFQAYGMAADADFVYWVDFDQDAGSIDHSRIVRLASGGGAPEVLVPDTLGAFPVVAYKGIVYYLDANGIHSVAGDGSPPVDVVASGGIGGFAVTTDDDGNDVVYWTDNSHGGLVWRGRLD